MRRKPAGRALNEFLRCAHLPGMRRATVTGRRVSHGGEPNDCRGNLMSADVPMISTRCPRLTLIRFESMPSDSLSVGQFLIFRRCMAIELRKQSQSVGEEPHLTIRGRSRGIDCSFERAFQTCLTRIFRWWKPPATPAHVKINGKFDQIGFAGIRFRPPCTRRGQLKCSSSVGSCQQNVSAHRDSDQ